MHGSRTYALRCLAAAAALSLAPIAAGAGGGEAGGFDSRSWGTISDELGQEVVKTSRYSLDMLGIAEMKCDCSFVFDGSERFWLFQAEPEIGAVDRHGPSDGKLKKGDVLVAIDGLLITTKKAGARFANLVAGEPVEFTIRRGSGTHSVSIVPRAVAEPTFPGEFVFHSSDNMRTMTVTPLAKASSELARSIEELSKRSAELGKEIDSLGVSSSLSSPELGVDIADAMPKGWIGFGLMFKGSISDSGPNTFAKWRFKTPPKIKSIERGGPADRAGLLVGDVLLEIDGLRLVGKKGGERFSRLQPGQTVEWKVQRDGETLTIKMTAGERP